MSGTIVGIDGGGLATCGLVALDARSLACYQAAVFSAEPDHKLDSNTDLRRRARELSRWLAWHLDRHKPWLVAAEEISLPPGQRIAKRVGIAWGVLESLCEQRTIPIVTALPLAWRKHLHKSKRESEAHGMALVTAPTARTHIARLDNADQPHALDGLGVAVWGLSTDDARRVFGDGR